jgi:DNA modification methylase
MLRFSGTPPEGKQKMTNLLLQGRYVCPVCGLEQDEPVGAHIRQQHGERAFVQAVLDAKRTGMNDVQIGEQFGITFKQLERIITQAVGVNVSTLSPSKRIKRWEPTDFRLESTTVWSFKQRGSWATHDGRYRGNWSPYIPRNLILRYTKPGDLVLDPFVGGGTTAVEAKLLGRRCIARDINPLCVEMTLENLRFALPRTLFAESPVYEPDVSVGDARYLEGIADNSVDLICAHPPYAGIIPYTSSIEGDLSQLGVPEFLNEMRQVASECYRVLKPGSKCAVLIGDTRQRKHVVPIGFSTIDVFLQAGFRLKELVIKRQHNCRTTGFWRKRSIRYNFLLLAHEYLPIFEKPMSISQGNEQRKQKGSLAIRQIHAIPLIYPEITTVWAVPANGFERHISSQLASRYGLDTLLVQLELSEGTAIYSGDMHDYLQEVIRTIYGWLSEPGHGRYIAIETADIRSGTYILPAGKLVINAFEDDSHLQLREIAIAIGEGSRLTDGSPTADLDIVHRYVLVYELQN